MFFHYLGIGVPSIVYEPISTHLTHFMSAHLLIMQVSNAMRLRISK